MSPAKEKFLKALGILSIGGSLTTAYIYDAYKEIYEGAAIITNETNGCFLEDISNNTSYKIDLLTCDYETVRSGTNLMMTCSQKNLIDSQCPMNTFNPCISGSTPVDCSRMFYRTKKEADASPLKIEDKKITCPSDMTENSCSVYCDSYNFKLKPTQFLKCVQRSPIQFILLLYKYNEKNDEINKKNLHVKNVKTGFVILGIIVLILLLLNIYVRYHPI